MRLNDSGFKILDSLVGTQYGDMTGIIQIDGHSNISELYELCSENGIDRDKYFLIGFGFSDFTTNGVGTHDTASCTVLLLDKDKYAGSFDEIKVVLMQNTKIEVVKKTFDVEYRDFKKYIKRVDALMLTEMGNYIQEMSIIESEDE